MIKLLWMCITALGFTLGGAFLAHFELQAGGIILCATWLWFAFPAAVMWGLKGIGTGCKKLGALGRKKEPASEAV